MKKNLLISTLQSFFLDNWWVIASALIFFGIYESASYKAFEAKTRLTERILSLNEQIRSAKEKNVLFCQELASTSDPAWIEMQLIHKLGLVHKGQKKVLIRHKEPQ